MRHTEKLSFLAVLLCFAACTKSRSSTENTNGIAGQWNIVSDSTYEGVALGNHLVDYKGQAGDYFIFSTDGHLYTKEAGVRVTLTYNLASTNSIIISDFGLSINGMPDTCTITGLGTQTIVIESPDFLTPGGAFWRKTTLSR